MTCGYQPLGHSLCRSHCQDLCPTCARWVEFNQVCQCSVKNIMGLVSDWGKGGEDESMPTASSLLMTSAWSLMVSLKIACSVTTTAVHFSPAMHMRF